MIFLSAYDTTVGRTQDVEALRSQIRLAIGRGEYTPSGKSSTLLELLTKSKKDETVDPYPHPLYLTTNTREERVTYDARPFTVYSRDKNVSVISDQRQYDQIQNRAILEAVLRSPNGIDVFRNMYSLPMKVYTRWVAGTLGRRFNLDYDALKRLTAFTGWFFLGLMDTADVNPQDDRVMTKKVNQLADQCKLPREYVLEVVGELPAINGIPQFVDILRQQEWADSLRQLDIRTFLVLMVGAWFGYGARDIVGASIEHLPTFFTLIYTACNDNAFRDTPFGKLLRDEREFKDAKLAYMRNFGYATGKWR